MLILDVLPENEQKFTRLLSFLREILELCSSFDAPPVLNGSLAVLAYTRKRDLIVNDIDLILPEANFPQMVSMLAERGISYKLKEWHVLQMLRDDLKIEFDSREYWAKDLPPIDETLQIGDLQVKMVSLPALKELYRRGLADTERRPDENNQMKYKVIKTKYDALHSLDA